MSSGPPPPPPPPAAPPPAPGAVVWRYPGLGRRALGFAIDFAIFWFSYGAILTIVFPEGEITTEDAEIAGLITIGALTIWFNYIVFSLWRWGQTVGHRATDLHVLEEGGGKPSWNRCLIRTLLLPVDVLVGVIAISTSDRERRVGDMAARTVVLRETRPLVAMPPPGSMPPPPGAASPPPGAASPPPGSMPPPSPLSDFSHGPPLPEPASVPSAAPAAALAPVPETAQRGWRGIAPGNFGPVDVVRGVLLVIGVVFVGGAVAGAFQSLDENVLEMILQGLFAAALIGVPFLVASGPGRLMASPAELGLRRFPLGQGIGTAALTYLTFFVILVVYSLVASPEEQQLVEEVGAENDTVRLIVLGVLIVLAAPICEEIFFRGFAYAGLRRRLGFWPAAAIVGIVFGLLHAPGGIDAVPPLVIFGFLLCFIYERTGSIWPAIGVHMLQNSLAFAINASLFVG